MLAVDLAYVGWDFCHRFGHALELKYSIAPPGSNLALDISRHCICRWNLQNFFKASSLSFNSTLSLNTVFIMSSTATPTMDEKKAPAEDNASTTTQEEGEKPVGLNDLWVFDLHGIKGRLDTYTL